MQVPALRVASKVTPEEKPVTFEADISDGPKAGESANHIAGSAAAYRASYPDRHAFCWWTADGVPMPLPTETEPDPGDGDDSGTPVEPGSPTPEPPFSPNVSLLAVSNAYTDSYLFLKNGAPVTGDALAAYNSILKFFSLNKEWGDSGTNLSLFLGTEDGYHQARPSRMYDKALLYALRMTGDRRMLDRLYDNAQFLYAAHKTGWLSSIVQGSAGAGPSPFKCLYFKQGQPNSQIGRDQEKANNVKLLERALLYAYVFNLNRGMVSPRGYNYGAEADRWKALLISDLIPKWYGDEPALSYPVDLTRGTHDSSAGWSAGYRGRISIPGYTGGRASASNPILFRADGHTGVTAGLSIALYMPKVCASGEFGTAAQWASEYNLIKRVFLQDELVDTPSAYGTAAVYTGNFRSWSGGGFLHPVGYGSYLWNDLLNAWLETGDADFLSPLQKLARSVADFVLDGGTSTIAPDIGGGVSRSGLPPSGASRRTAFHGVYYAMPEMMVLDTPDDKIELTTKAIMQRYGSLAAPRSPHYGAGVVLKFARASGLF